MGALLGMILVVQGLLDPRGLAFGLTMLLTRSVTIAGWLRRLRGEMAAPRWIQRVAWTSLLVGTLVGLAGLVRDLQGALSGA